MDILQIVLGIGVLGFLGVIVYGVVLVLYAGPQKTKEDINKDERFK